MPATYARRAKKAPERQVISLAIATALLRRIDAIASAEQRSRAAQMNIMLERAVRDYPLAVGGRRGRSAVTGDAARDSAA
jgi:hypothetical protein